MLTITKSLFGTLPGDVPVYAYTMANGPQFSVTAITYGGIITDLRVPDRSGRCESVVLGYDTLSDYQENAGLYLGALVGRLSGRIGRAQFPFSGETVVLPANEGENSLHGNGEFSKAVFSAATNLTADCAEVLLRYRSPDGAEGFPGAVEACITYSLSADNVFTIRFDADTDADTVLNLTNHTYFNLSGNLRDTVRSHMVTADVTDILELAEDLIPTGRRIPVDGTPFDLRTGSRIDDAVVSEHPQAVLVGHGFDHPFLFREDGDHTVVLSEPVSGRRLTLKTDYPCLVIYTGNYLDDAAAIRGIPSRKYFGVALEAQLYPDAPNHADFPPVLLRAGEHYAHTTSWTFDVL